MIELEGGRNNRQRVFGSVYRSNMSLTKLDLAKTLNLSLPTVSHYLGELFQEGLLMYGETGVSTGGRKPRTFSIVSDARYAIGVSITEKTVSLLAINLFVEEVAYEKIALPFEDVDSYYERISSLIEAFASKHHLPTQKILGVGITFPGIVKEEQDMVEYLHRLHLRKKALADVRKFFSFEVHFVNDANASGFAEWWYRHEAESTVYLSIDRGVGGSVMIHQQCYLGDNGRSGEFGHMCIHPDGNLCSCGRRGCLEAHCSTSKISDDLGLTMEAFFEKVHLQDPAILPIWDDYLAHLARGIATIRTVMDCPIVLSGRLAPFMEEHLPKLTQLVAELSSFDQENPYLYLARFRSRSANVGAALYFVNRLIEEI